jgi:opacity protein-like surface antigen
MGRLGRKFNLRNVRRSAPGAALFVAAFSSATLADDLEQPGNFRASTYAGVFIPQSESWMGSGTLSGLPFNATGKLSSNTGWATGDLLGYSFEDVPGWEWLNIDLAVGYVASTFNHFDGTIAIAGVGNFSGPAPLVGQYHTVAGFVNFLATPFGIRQLFDDKVTPFIGVGPGVAGSTAKIQTFSLGPTTLPINATSTETDFAFDAIVGADYEIAQHWDLGASYQYTWINVKHLGGGAGIQANTGPASGHSIGVVLEYRFGKAS